MLTSTQDRSVPSPDAFGLSTSQAPHPQTQARASRPLSQRERDLLAARSGGHWRVLLALSIAAAGAGALMLPLGFSAATAVLTACVAFMLSLNFPVAENRGGYVRDDIALDSKIGVAGRIAGKRMRGWLRPHCALTVTDAAGSRAQTFKLPAAAYAAVREGQPAMVWYVPSSGIVMELSEGSYRYRLGDAEPGQRSSQRV
ncbi:hypothetical protein ACI2IY_19300 [Lysobacter enzymogenes]|uniref:hypothetical protein n=1 Tax=Lysobacter enzymogenes TaxID=69 RepID=UPI00384FFDC3